MYIMGGVMGEVMGWVGGVNHDGAREEHGGCASGRAGAQAFKMSQAGLPGLAQGLGVGVEGSLAYTTPGAPGTSDPTPGV